MVQLSRNAISLLCYEDCGDAGAAKRINISTRTEENTMPQITTSIDTQRENIRRSLDQIAGDMAWPCATPA